MEYCGDVRTAHRKSPLARLTSLPTVPRLPVRLYIYSVAYEQAIHRLVFLSSAHRCARSDCLLGT